MNSDLWLAIFRGFSAGSSLEEQTVSGQNLLLENGIPDEAVHVIRALDLGGTFLVEAPDDVAEDTLKGELESIPGFAALEEYDRSAATPFTPDGSFGPGPFPINPPPDDPSGDPPPPAAGWATSTTAPTAGGLMILLSNGTVMVQGAQSGGVTNNWNLLTPAANGDYASGTWSSIASMGNQRLYYGSNVLPDGRVLLVGGEYSGPSGVKNIINTGEIYDPVANTWTAIAPFPQAAFGDDPTELLPDGRVLAGYIFDGRTYIYDPATDTWSQTGTKLRNDRSDEETWNILPDGSILSYDVFQSPASGPGFAQRYIPSTGTWVDTGPVPVPLSGSSVGFELGPAVLLPDGRVFLVGANNNTVLYTPSTNSWAVGPTLPAGLGADDTPGAVLPNGHVIFAADTSIPLFTGPTHLFDFDPTAPIASSLTEFTGQADFPPALTTALNHGAYTTRMLTLPNGQVLFNPGAASQLWVFTPSGGPDASWRPTISSIAANADGSYTLTGTQLNGISEGASYGDDAEMSSNYPIVQLTSGTNVYYARTFNWSNTGVATGSLPVTAQFTLPAGLPAGNYSLSVVASGIASASVPFNVPLSVTSSTPADKSIVFSSPPASYVVNFSSPIDLASLQPSDLRVNGIAANGVTLDGSQTVATFTYSVSPVVNQGVQSLAIAAGSITKDGDTSSAIAGYFSNFRYDSPVLAVTTTVPAANGVLTLPSPSSFVVNFNEPIAPNSISTDDLTLSVGSVTAAVATGPSQATYTISNITAEGNITITLGAGKVTDASGNPSTVAFSANYILDLGTSPYPVPLAEKNPAGSLIYDPTTTGLINFAGDTDTFTVAVDAGQTITILVTPTSAGLQPSVQLFDPTSALVGNATAAAAGQPALIQPVGPTASGTYRIAVTGAGSTTGNYTVQVIVNAAVESESAGGATNNTRATAQDLTASFIKTATGQASSQRGAVAGQFKDDDDFFSFTLAAAQNVTVGLATPGNLGSALFAATTSSFGTGSGQTAPTNLVYADLNGDGKLDMVVADSFNGSAASVCVRLGNGDGTFGTVTLYSTGGNNSKYVAVGDTNGDGKLDVVVTSQSSNIVSLLLGTGTGTLGTATTYSVGSSPFGVILADLNADGRADAVTANNAGGNVSVRLGQSDGTLGALTNFSVGATGPRAVAAGDLNADGKLDLVTSNITTSNISVLLGTGTGSFGAATTFSMGSGSWGVALADFNGDSKLDVVTSNQVGNNISVRLGTGTGSFNAVTNFSVGGTAPQSVAVGDVNGDGKLDIATANTTSANVSVLLGTGTGIFGTATTFATGVAPNSVVLADVNGNGGLDLSSADFTPGTISLRLNSRVQLQLQDSTGAVLATGSSAANLSAAINNVSLAAGTYYVRVFGQGNTSYNLLVTRDALFDTEPNDTSATPQALGTSSGALGAIVQTVVSPAILATTDGNYDNAYPFNIGAAGVSSMRYQQIYSRSEFAQPGTITALRFRRDSDESTFTTTGIDVKINLGYAATNFSAPSSTFANNVGVGTTTVLDTSSLTLSSSGSGTPRPFDIVITLATPFTYDPTKGDLLLDVFMRNAPTTRYFDASNSGQESTTRRIYATNVNNTAGSIDSTFTGLVTRFDMATNDDWYSLNVTSTTSNIELVTNTPADGVNQFVNTLNPHLELYNPSNALVASGVNLADARNEFIQYLPPVTGTYKVHVTGESSTSGEYFVSVRDTSAPRVTAVTVVPGILLTSGAVLAPGSMSIQVTFSEPMRSSNLDSSDFSLRGNFRGQVYSLNGFSFSSDGTVLTLNYTDLPDDSYTLTLVAGASGGANFTDAAGNALDGEFSGAYPSGDGTAGGNFILNFSKDLDTEAYPLPLSAEPPAGGLIYDPSVTRTIAFAGDTDSFTLAVDPGQTISVLVNQANSTLKPTVELRDPANNLLASATATSALQPVFLSAIAATTGGVYTVTVSGAGGTTGQYVAQITLNSALEAENNGGATNDTRATAQTIDNSFIALATASVSASRGAVFGGNGVSAAWSDYYSFTVSANTNVSAVLKHLTGSGANVFIENSAGSVLATGATGAANYDRGINNLLITTAGTYYLRVSGAAAATYSAVLIKNAAFDTEANDAFATAQNITGTAGVLGAIVPSAGSSAGSTVVPGSLANVEGNTNNTIPFASATSRYQQIYSASQFASGGIIDAIRFRRNGTQGTFTTSGLNVQINLAYAATTVAAPSLTFANNIGGGNVTVYNGPLTLSSTGSGSGGPNPFDVVIDVANSFIYNPALGDLLLDVRVTGNASASFSLDAASSSQQSSMIRIYNTSVNNTAGNVGSGNEGSPYGLVTRFDFLTPTPEADWYSINVANSAPNLRLETSTPADGQSQFNNTLNPHLELYNPAGNFVASGVVLADGRNESLQFHAPGLTPGTYRVRLSADSGSTWGEYFLGALALPNQLPTAANDPAVVTSEDTSVLINVLANDADPDGSLDATTVAIGTTPTHGSVSINPTTGQITYAPTLNYSGPDSFTYTVQDDSGAVSNIATVILNAIAVADSPTLTVADAAGDEGSAIPLSVAAALNDTDGSESLSVQISGVPALAQLSAGTNSGGGVWTVAPADLSGLTISVPDDASFSLTVTATATENSNSDQASTTGSIRVDVSNVAPALSGLSTIAIQETGTTTLTGTIRDVGTLDTFTVVIDWGSGTQTFTNVAAGTFDYTRQYLDDNAADSYAIQVVVTDDDGGSVDASTTVTVTNTDPNATNNTYTANQAFSISGNLITDNTGSGIDTDPAGALDPLSISSHTDPANGVLVLYANGSFTYTPDSTFAGTDSFSYVINDGDGGYATATVTITVVAAAPGSILTIPDSCIPGATALLITGTAAGDNIIVEPGTTSGTLKVTFNGISTTVAKPTGRIIVTGGAGDDNIQITGAIDNSVWLYGDAGNDRLNAGNGGSLLIGGDGNDQLLGGSGRDVMIGGEGADQIVGNSSDDVLVAGFTTKDARTAVNHEGFWCDVLEEWNSSNAFAVRVQNLRNGAGGNAHNGSSLLLPVVCDDMSVDAIDFLNGAAGDDWLIFLVSEDKVAGQAEASQ